MGFICRLFGHKPAHGYYGEGAGYLRSRYAATDGLGVVHVDLYSTCERCETEFRVGKLHLPRRHTDQEQKAYEKLAQDLATRAAIRRSIPRGEPDRIADVCERAAAAIRYLNKD